MVFATARKCIAGQVEAVAGAWRAAAGARGPNLVSLQMAHVQDEADMRLLSTAAHHQAGLPRRSRRSK
eukprot:9263565-Karenia_brevis.AAC.1